MNDFLSDNFFEFINTDADRVTKLKTLLHRKDVPFSQISLAGTQHIIVQFPQSSYNPLFATKTIIAHYDRTQQSPGANDNSAAVYMLASFAAFLLSKHSAKKPHNIRIIFTGNEELADGQTICSQGSFALGTGLRKLGCGDSLIFVTDCCGRGDTLIVAETPIDNTNTATPFMQSQNKLKQIVRELCAQTSHGLCEQTKTDTFGWLSLPVPYGDNAGLTAACVPSQLITILPSSEAAAFAQAVTESPELRKTLVSRQERDRCPQSTARLPKTWQLINTAADTPDTLTKSAFVLFSAFLTNLQNLTIVNTI